MSVLFVAGSPSQRSRSGALLDAVGLRLAPARADVERLDIRELPAQALLLADTSNRGISKAVDQLARAQVIVIATPVYKAAYSGLLKVFLDLLPQFGLKDKLVLPLATGGSPNHMLAVDYALRPVLQSLGARQILGGVYATDAQVTLLPEGAHQLHADIAERLDDAVATIFIEGRLKLPANAGFEPVDFSRVRCSV